MNKLYFLFSCLMFLVSCEESSSAGSFSNYLGSGSSSSSSGSVTGGYAYLEIYGILEGPGAAGGAEVLLDRCEVEIGSPLGADIDCPAFSHEEGALHHSELRFRWGTNSPSDCPFLKFYPYYYRASNSAAFSPEWLNENDPAIDCSDPENNDRVNCYGGIAPLLASSDFKFPNTDYYFHLTNIQTAYSVLVSSSYSLERRSNRMVANPPSTYVVGGTDRIMADGSDGIVSAFPGGYTGNLVNLRHYRVVCEDLFADEVYALTYYLRDHDIAGPPPANAPNNPLLNNYPDWTSNLDTLDPQ